MVNTVKCFQPIQEQGVDTLARIQCTLPLFNHVLTEVAKESTIREEFHTAGPECSCWPTSSPVIDDEQAAQAPLRQKEAGEAGPKDGELQRLPFYFRLRETGEVGVGAENHERRARKRTGCKAHIESNTQGDDFPSSWRSTST